MIDNGTNILGEVRCWGLNSSGQLGDGSENQADSPQAVTNLDGLISDSTRQASALAAGDNHTCALTKDGKVRCWGLNSSGQLGNNSSINSSIPVAVQLLDATELTGAAGITAGADHTCAWLTNGEAMCWGGGFYGRLGDGSTSNSARLYASNVCETGNGTCTIKLTGVAAVAAGAGFTCALLTDESVTCWGGDNALGQLGTGTFAGGVIRLPTDSVTGILTGQGAKQLSTGDAHACVILGAGTMRCWGQNNIWSPDPNAGRIGDGTADNTARPHGVDLPPITP